MIAATRSWAHSVGLLAGFAVGCESASIVPEEPEGCPEVCFEWTTPEPIAPPNERTRREACNEATVLHGSCPDGFSCGRRLAMCGKGMTRKSVPCLLPFCYDDYFQLLKPQGVSR